MRTVDGGSPDFVKFVTMYFRKSICSNSFLLAIELI